MMKIVALLALLTPLSLLASGLINIDIQNLEGDYANDSGKARAARWHLPDAAAIENAEFTVLKEQDSFFFTGDAGEFVLEDLPELILDMESLRWRGANFKMNKNVIDFSLSSLSGNSSALALKASSADLNCQGASSSSSLLIAGLETCLNKGSLRAALLEFAKTARSATWLKGFFSSVLSQEVILQTGLENLKVDINRGAFDLKLKAKLDISVNIKAQGKITLAETSSGAEIKVRLDKVKASFLNVTKKVFEAIEDNPIDGVRVERPYIILEVNL